MEQAWKDLFNAQGRLLWMEHDGYLYFNTVKGFVYKTRASRPEASRIRRNTAYTKLDNVEYNKLFIQ